MSSPVASPLSERGPGHVVSESVVVGAPPETVFAIVADPSQHPRIDGGGSVQRLLSGPGRLQGKGDRFSVAMRLFGVAYRITNTVVEYEPDRRIAWRHFGGHRWRYELAPTGDGGTRVTETFDYSRYSLPWRLFVEVTGFPGRNRAGITGTLQRLKDAAERDARV